ncbi:MAG: glycerophosphoryl diester phosphodiesterase membrane domain-containing protein [Novosphingobium sp.]
MRSNPKLDTNLAWQNAHAAIKGNREALLAIAGVFFFLPSLAFALLYPQPPAAPGAMTPQQAVAFFEKFYRESLPFTLAMTVSQIVGTMAILRLFAGQHRPTVGDAIAKGAVDAAVFLLSMFGLSLLGSVVAGLILAVAAVTGQQAVAGVAMAAVVVVLSYVFVRLILVMPVMAVEGLRNPAASLPRSWALTRGNVGRILLFMMLMVLAYVVILSMVSAVFGIAVALVLGAEGAKIVVAVVAAALGAVFTLYLSTSLAAIHRQLAGPSEADLRTTFD